MTPKLATSLSSSICEALDQALKQELSLGNERGGAEETQVLFPARPPSQGLISAPAAPFGWQGGISGEATCELLATAPGSLHEARKASWDVQHSQGGEPPLPERLQNHSGNSTLQPLADTDRGRRGRRKPAESWEVSPMGRTSKAPCKEEQKAIRAGSHSQR